MTDDRHLTDDSNATDDTATERRHEIRDGDGFFRRDGSRSPTFDVWAVEDGRAWCVDAGIRGLRAARRCASAWQRGYREALSE